MPETPFGVNGHAPPSADNSTPTPEAWGIPPDLVARGLELRRAVALLTGAGLSVCRVDPFGKGGADPGWCTRSVRPEDVGPHDRIGIVTGPLSDGGLPGHCLVGIDLDSEAAVRLADEYLPATGMIDGRPGKPRSHRYYLVPLGTIPDAERSRAPKAGPAAVEAAGHPGPRTRSYRDAGKREVVKLCGTGSMLVCPPSGHPSGESRVWEGGTPGTPAVVTFPELALAVRALAVAAGAIDRAATARPDSVEMADTTGPADRDYADDSLVRRVSAYLDACPPCVSGRGGHDQLFSIARALVRGFDLDPDTAAGLILARYNPRCLPPWSAAEIAHKCEDADRVPFDKPRGYLLGRAGSTGDPPGVPPGFPADGPPDVPLSDVGNAWRFALDHADSARYVEAQRAWLIWDGARWKVDDTRAVAELAKRTAAGLYRDASDYCRRAASGSKEDQKKAEAVLVWARKSHDANRLTRMIDLARSDPRLARRSDVFDVHPFLLNVANGTLDLTTGELRPHSRDDHLTQLCPTRYDPAAACPEWERFLDGIFPGDAELIAFVRRLLGYALTGSDREDIFAVLWGEGSNGKSTLTETIEHVVGPDYCTQVAEGALMARSGDGASHTTDLADLRGKRLAFCSETEDNRQLAKALVKRLSGGGTMKARHAYERNVEFRQTWTLLLQTNHKPNVAGGTHAEWRRIRLVPFTVEYWDPDEPAKPGGVRPPHLKADKTLAERLKAEAEGILAWLVRGCREWQQNGLGHCKAVSGATQEYKEDEDIFARFICERIDRQAGVSVGCTQLYKAFRIWCEGIIPESSFPSTKAFVSAMTARGFVRNGSRTRYEGIFLRPLAGGERREVPPSGSV